VGSQSRATFGLSRRQSADNSLWESAHLASSRHSNQPNMAPGSKRQKRKAHIRKPKKSDKAVSDSECTDSWSLVNSPLIPHSDVAASAQATSLPPHPSVAVGEPSPSTSAPEIVVHESTSQGHEHSYRALPQCTDILYSIRNCCRLRRGFFQGC
jgi:hypothetical protein